MSLVLRIFFWLELILIKIIQCYIHNTLFAYRILKFHGSCLTGNCASSIQNQIFCRWKNSCNIYLYTVFYFRNIVRITFWRSSLILTIKCFVWCFMWVWKYSYSIAEKYITRVSYTYDRIIFIFHSKIKRCIKIIFFNQKEFWYTSNLIPKITSIFWFPKSGLISKIYPLYIIFRY